jgi:hypothetical protein
MVWIAGQNFGVGSGSFQFTSIPQTFSHLQMRVFFRGSDTGAVSYSNVYVNGDAYTTNYSMHNLIGDGSTAYAAGTANAGGIGNLFSPGASSTANVFAAGIVDVLDYTNTNKYKTLRILWGYDANGSGNVSLSSGMLKSSTAAITSLGIFNFTSVAGCRIDLYGITSSQVTGA